MLTLHRGVIADDDIALVQVLSAIYRHAVFHRRADGIGNEHRHAAGGLREQFANGADKADRVVFVLVNIRAERRARHVGVDLIADRDDAMADDFERDRVYRHFFRRDWRSCLVHGKAFFPAVWRYFQGTKMLSSNTELA